MSDTELGSNDGMKGTGTRNLPSLMSSKGKQIMSSGKKHVDVSTNEEVYEGKKSKKSTSYVKSRIDKGKVVTNTGSMHVCNLLEGVVFVLSGFVNPERSVLRSQALAMGAEYRPDWTSECTLLVCAFPNTPKYRQVEEDCGTIVSKEWISECYNHKKLVEIDAYLMHAGKPWRENKNTHVNNQDPEMTLGKPHQPVKKEAYQKKIVPTALEVGPANIVNKFLSPFKVKEWAVDDLNKTMSWLNSQDEKPKPSELKKIASEGILTCLQDAIEALEEDQDIQPVTEQWKFIPRVVKELAKVVDMMIQTGSVSKKELYEQAKSCKHIYHQEFDGINTTVNNKKQKKDHGDDDSEKTEIMTDDTGFDSDETIEIEKEELDLACERLSYKH